MKLKFSTGDHLFLRNNFLFLFFKIENWSFGTHGNRKNQNLVGSFGASRKTALPIYPIWPIFVGNGLDWHCYLKNGPQDFEFLYFQLLWARIIHVRRKTLKLALIGLLSLLAWPSVIKWKRALLSLGIFYLSKPCHLGNSYYFNFLRYLGSNGFQIKWVWHPLQLKIQNHGGRFLELPAKQHCQFSPFGTFS